MQPAPNNVIHVIFSWRMITDATIVTNGLR